MKDQSFNDIIYHAKALDFWEQEYNQLSEASFQSRLMDLSFNGLRIFREQMNCRVAQCTKTPPNTVNILIPIRMLPEKEQVSTQGLCTYGATLLPAEAEFFFCTPPDTDYIVISLHRDLLAQRLIQQDVQRILQTKIACGMLLNHQVSTVLIEKCTHILETYLCHAMPLTQEEKQQICDDITDLVMHYFADIDEQKLPREVANHHQHIVKYTYSRVLESENSLSILDLCQELQIPHRSLHYAFEKTAGMSPNKYIRALRLNAADRIMHAQSEKSSLTDLAYQYGFSHSSHFGREYKKLFGRIPSKILSS